MSEPTGAEWLNETVRISGGDIYFGEHKLPGCIAADGVEVKPGNRNEINQLTVTFYVGQVIAADPSSEGSPDELTHSR